MPTYDYRCETCGETWELEQRITEDPVKDCPACGSPTAKRLITGGNFILKGSGWYADLYHKPAAGSEAAKKGDGEKSGAAAKKEGKAAETSPKSDAGASKPAKAASGKD